MTRQRQLLGLVVALAIAALVVGVGVARSDGSLVGSEHRVTLSWSCWNGIGWEDEHGRHWWAGEDPVVSGKLDTQPTTDGHILHRRHATGTLRVESKSRAVFASDAGGTVVLHPDRSQFKQASCRLGP